MPCFSAISKMEATKCRLNLILISFFPHNNTYQLTLALTLTHIDHMKGDDCDLLEFERFYWTILIRLHSPTLMEKVAKGYPVMSKLTISDKNQTQHVYCVDNRTKVAVVRDYCVCVEDIKFYFMDSFANWLSPVNIFVVSKNCSSMASVLLPWLIQRNILAHYLICTTLPVFRDC